MNMLIPPGLLAVRDVIERHPDERAPLIAWELKRRARERLLNDEMRSLLYLHLGQVLQGIFVSGVYVFLGTYLASKVGELARAYEHAHNLPRQAVFPVWKEIPADVMRLIPTSSVIQAAARLPTWGWPHAALFALAAAAFVFAFRVWGLHTLWRRTRLLRQAMQDLKLEEDTLNAWLSEPAMPLTVESSPDRLSSSDKSP